MNRKPWITTLTSAVVVSLALAATPAVAGHAYAVGKRHDDQGVYAYARVLSAEPIVRYVTVNTPVRECWEETRYYTVENRPNTAGGTILGAVIGGVVGHQFGSGSGNDAATVAGTLIGAAVGNDVAKRRAYSAGNYGSTRYAEPVERCATNYQSHQEERIEGYRVVYQFQGQKYATRMPYDPGERIRVRVDVRPAA
ncbi:MAG: glycine zipper 2TM domain-containing protein [Gammaproteobacteria bacterium]|nr:glycine zipper 2TM domain-containing protein [Gammaproteobacteria bacterium]MDH4254853.1 glycine zipper 2TM domain-containing protein [Gammaproteobacteria bacterium]MDH5310185.1 glycine zipper 2TM domain-containing protein [Gammaproteobacteria bacterium]